MDRVEIRSEFDLQRTELEIISKDNVHISRRAHEVMHMGNSWARNVIRQSSDVVDIFLGQSKHVHIGHSELKDPVFALSRRESIFWDAIRAATQSSKRQV